MSRKGFAPILIFFVVGGILITAVAVYFSSRFSSIHKSEIDPNASSSASAVSAPSPTSTSFECKNSKDAHFCGSWDYTLWLTSQWHPSHTWAAPPYPLSWDEGDTHFDINAIHIGFGLISAGDLPPNAVFDSEGTAYPPKSAFYAIRFGVKVSGNQSRKPELLRVADEKGSLVNSNSGGTLFIIPDDDIIPANDEYRQYLFSTGGTSNILFSIGPSNPPSRIIDIEPRSELRPDQAVLRMSDIPSSTPTGVNACNQQHEAVASLISKQVKDFRSCTVDADCQVIKGQGCPYDCGVVINKDGARRLNQLIDEYFNYGCKASCITECVLYDRAICVNRQCDINRINL